ncbi:MAG: hypothetical protein HON68_10065 [Gammaproteobacteria bacterium]|jgi:uncharacterized protein|nr:hypothetical protein [Gammaproteobacteria bacterium]MBT3488485.1 hypothetical protein [Gammaproteobacteria bacterium]MBT3718441.1 hypothetical protein [Gammaproteobacteria bacterium]MBT3845945.1 hypothetical protein [Gammaproteobacteria bacterium]MBT3893654.1 hypothetical protein [Gammaproteobacteria bacterium]
MNLLQATYEDGHSIRRYSTTTIQIAEKVYQRSLLLAPDSINPGWGPDNPNRLNSAHLDMIAQLSPEVILLGTGLRRVLFTTPEQQHWLQRFPGMEIMETGAACRTYNLLLSEGRRVVAGLILER